MAGPGSARLFVYGSLMAGFSRHRCLGSAVLDAVGRVRGSLRDLGAYPGLVLDDGGWVHGELYRLPGDGRPLARLDREEGYDPANEAGSLFVRRRLPVTLPDGDRCEAWVYVYNGSPGRGSRVPSGDWRLQVAARGAGQGPEGGIP